MRGGGGDSEKWEKRLRKNEIWGEEIHLLFTSPIFMFPSLYNLFVTYKPNILMSFTQTLRQIISECKLSSLCIQPRAKQTKPNNSPSFNKRHVSYHAKNIQ